MPNINIEITDELLKAIRVTCAVRGESQKDWVPRILKEATNGDINGTDKVDGRARSVRDGVGGVGRDSPKKRGNGSSGPRETPGFGEPGVVHPALPTDDDTARVLIDGEKCNLCQSPVYEFRNPTTAALKWKCTGKTPHTITPREARRN